MKVNIVGRQSSFALPPGPIYINVLTGKRWKRLLEQYPEIKRLANGPDYLNINPPKVIRLNLSENQIGRASEPNWYATRDAIREFGRHKHFVWEGV